jgi:hypothetical protein
MDNVQNCDSYITIATSQTYGRRNYFIYGTGTSTALFTGSYHAPDSCLLRLYTACPRDSF